MKRGAESLRLLSYAGAIANGLKCRRLDSWTAKQLQQLLAKAVQRDWTFEEFADTACEQGLIAPLRVRMRTVA